MIEGRAIIESIKKTKDSVESLGGTFKGNYILKDVIFVPKKKNYNLSDDFLRVRINIKSNWPTKRVILVRKQTEFKEVGKIDKTILRKEFDSEEEAFSFIKENFPEFKKGFDYEREGWQYQLNDYRIFIEDIKGWKPSIEVEAREEKEIRKIFNMIGILQVVKSSVPEVMRQII